MNGIFGIDGSTNEEGLAPLFQSFGTPREIYLGRCPRLGIGALSELARIYLLISVQHTA